MKTSDSSKSCDVAIIVAKNDELRAIEQAFGADFKKSAGSLKLGKLYYRTEISTRPNLRVFTVCMNGQGNELAARVTEQTISEFDPAIAILVGTAIGRRGKINIGHVIVSKVVVDVQEWRIEKEPMPRIRMHDVLDTMTTDVDRFLQK